MILEIVGMYNNLLLTTPLLQSQDKNVEHKTLSYAQVTNLETIKKAIGNYYSKEHDGQVGEVNRELIDFVKERVAFERMNQLLFQTEEK